MAKIYSDLARTRIDNVVKHVESGMVDLTAQGRGRAVPLRSVWFELDEDLDSETYTAEATMCVWSASVEDGNGDLTATGETFTVRDTTKGKLTVAAGDWVRCRPLGSLNGTVWEIITGNSSCSSTVVMTLIEPLNAGGTAQAIPYVTEIPENATGIEVCDNIMPNDTTIPTGATIYVTRFNDCKLRVIAVSCDVLGDGNCGSGYLEECNPPPE